MSHSQGHIFRSTVFGFGFGNHIQSFLPYYIALLIIMFKHKKLGLASTEIQISILAKTLHWHVKNKKKNHF